MLPVSEKILDYGGEVARRLAAAGLRVELDESNEKLGYKIRDAQMQKMPYMLVVGREGGGRRDGGGAAAHRRGVPAVPLGPFCDWLGPLAAVRSGALPEPSGLV